MFGTDKSNKYTFYRIYFENNDKMSEKPLFFMIR